MRSLSALAMPLVLAACATSNPGAGSGATVTSASIGDANPFGYQAEFDALKAGCDKRNGMLVPTPARPSGRPALDYTCRIHGGASDFVRRQPGT